MTNKSVPSTPQKPSKIVHSGMMGDGTEEQNLNETGDPSLRINKDEVNAAFDKKNPKSG
jgi:hypothetical protein